MSSSVRPHRGQPTRLLRPWDSPGKNTGVGCHFLLQCVKVTRENKVAQSCPTLSDPMDCSLPGSSIHGIFQARVLEWGAIAFSPTPPRDPIKQPHPIKTPHPMACLQSTSSRAQVPTSPSPNQRIKFLGFFFFFFLIPRPIFISTKLILNNLILRGRVFLLGF